MFPKLETPRLVLNALKKKDAVVVFFLRSNNEVLQYIKRTPYKDLDEAEAFITLITEFYEKGASVTWALREKDGTEMIGSICLWNFSEDRKTAEVGYDLKPEYQGKGFMNEAMKAVTTYGFTVLQLHTIEAFTSRYNMASIQLLEKNMFVHNPNRADEDNSDNCIFELKPDVSL